MSQETIYDLNTLLRIMQRSEKWYHNVIFRMIQQAGFVHIETACVQNMLAVFSKCSNTITCFY